MLSDNWNHLMRPHDMKYIGFKHQRENKQNSDKSSYDILAYITKNYIALIYYAKIVHLLCQFHVGKVGFSAVCQVIYS